MRKNTVVILLALAVSAFAADRVVLMEDFTNCGCGPCWNFEPTITSFINTYSAHLAVVRPHVSWPTSSDPIYTANPTEQNFRRALYGVNAVPWLQFDGAVKASLSSSGLVSAYNNRMAVPCYLDIQVDNYAMDATGTLQITLIAEQDLQDTTLYAHAILVESGVPGTGYFSSSTFEQAFREELFGTIGEPVSFGPSYPDTLVLTVDYDTETWVYGNLQLAVFVQNHGGMGNTEVMNAWYGYLGDITGIEDQPAESGGNGMSVNVTPNPSSGTFSISVGNMPQSQGTVDIYDISGRHVASGSVSDDQPSPLELHGAGIYFARVSSGGETAVSRVVVLD